ncbi:hypothetical protein NLI96_g2110 [Meripilus lineatus]|uniref:Uncharacterized protein n=1 Tax=Meripilus lineatus TaxID=2056292 RepID=A0AAD5VBM8_9APHY|nr:hypothetical protein NLI96_g2110 [Physisporinus lineatus]
MLASIDPYTRKWDRDGNESTSSSDQVDSDAHCLGPRAVYWYYDQSTFYANDRRNTRWVHKSEKAQPKAKGEGASLMIADFVSPDYGWLQSPDGTESARVYFHAGKNRDGYFTTQNILDQASVAMDILEKHYPHDKHYLIYDNAPHQVARPPVALSARHMTKFPTQVGHVPFGVDVEVIGSDGQKVFGRNGQVLRRRVQMVGGKLPSGAPQSFYYPPGIQMREPSKEWLQFWRSVVFLGYINFEQSVKDSNAQTGRQTHPVAADACYSTNQTSVQSSLPSLAIANVAGFRSYTFQNFIAS